MECALYNQAGAPVQGDDFGDAADAIAGQGIAAERGWIIATFDFFWGFP